MTLTISTISFLAIMANSLKLTLTNFYFFKMIPSSRLFPIITTSSNYLTHLGFIIRFRWKCLNISWSGNWFSLDSRFSLGSGFFLGRGCITRGFHNLKTSNLSISKQLYKKLILRKIIVVDLLKGKVTYIGAL
ncbi:hypothetical protein ACB098_08G072900 [Castanea mollissima]